MDKNFPKRSESRAKYVFWIMFATVFACIGAVLMMGGSLVGVIMFFGGIGMGMRETALRMRYNKWAKAVRVE
jgi:mannose/fructose/N-acetylgalactosamine-specific phosphotransferase system component IID